MKAITKDELVQLLSLRFNRDYLCSSLKGPEDYQAIMDDLYLHSLCENYYLLHKKKGFYAVDLFINRHHPRPPKIEGILVVEYAYKRLDPANIDLIESLGFGEIMRRRSMTARVGETSTSYTILNPSFMEEVMAEIRENFDPHYGSIPSELELKKRFDHSEVIGALEDGKLLGFVEFSKSSRSLHIEHISVKKDYRGQGLGKRLIEDLFAYGQDLGIGSVELFVNSGNKVAQAMYREMGFKENKLESIVFRRDKYEG